MLRRNLDTSETIYSLVSGSLPCAVAVVRLSGPNAFPIAQQIFFPAPARTRQMTLGNLRDRSGSKVDEALMLGFVAPHSFTGEDCVEFQCHGSVAVVERLLGLLNECGARQAVRGEFSYRAFLQGKMSAADLEALGDVFRARQSEDLTRIYSRRDGSMERFVGRLREHLVGAQAILDTAVDFADEYSDVVSQAQTPLRLAIRECSEVIQRFQAFRDGGMVSRLVLAGRPNAGKSSLFNALLGRYRAIVNAAPGTTRDVIEEDIEVEGRRWKVVDTAGVRLAEGEAEQQGLTLGAEFLGASAFWLLVVDGAEGLSAEETDLLERYGSLPHLVAWNKADLPEWRPPSPGLEALAVSARTGQGISELWGRLRGELPGRVRDGEVPLPSAGQAETLRRLVEGLEGLLQALEAQVPPEYLAERNRLLMNRLDDVIGEVDTEQVLDRVFQEFCIGK